MNARLLVGRSLRGLGWVDHSKALVFVVLVLIMMSEIKNATQQILLLEHNSIKMTGERNTGNL